jgi:hypothetical protein
MKILNRRSSTKRDRTLVAVFARMRMSTTFKDEAYCVRADWNIKSCRRRITGAHTIVWVSVTRTKADIPPNMD